MGGMAKTVRKAIFTWGGSFCPPTLPGNSKPPPFLGLSISAVIKQKVVIYSIQADNFHKFNSISVVS
jgi:hypothetical protein